MFNLSERDTHYLFWVVVQQHVEQVEKQLYEKLHNIMDLCVPEQLDKIV